MAKKGLKQKAIEAVQNQYQDNRSFDVVSEISNFLDGKVFVVSDGADRDEARWCVYAANDEVSVFSSADQVAQKAAQKPKEPTVYALLHRIVTVGGIAGVIAIIIAVVIGVMAIQGQTIPQFLKYALSIVLGFYFGGAAGQYASTRAAGR